MRYWSQVKPISYLKANAAELLTRLSEQREPLVIPQNGEAKAMLQDVATLEETQGTLALNKIWNPFTTTSRNSTPWHMPTAFLISSCGS